MVSFDHGTSCIRPIMSPFVFLMSAVFPFASVPVTTWVTRESCLNTRSPTLIFFAMPTFSHRPEPIARPVEFKLHHYRRVHGLDRVRVRAYSYPVRYSPQHKSQNHEKILSVAARSFREVGGDSSGIGTVMKKVGLTKGGFYRHFESKDDLFVEAVARAFDEMGSGMLKIAKSAPEGQAMRAIIEHYLSARHANSPGMGCVAAALGPELARKPLPVRKRIEASREAYRERLLPFVPGQTQEEKLAKYQGLFPSMAGGLTSARMTLSSHKRDQILREARDFFIK